MLCFTLFIVSAWYFHRWKGNTGLNMHLLWAMIVNMIVKIPENILVISANDRNIRNIRDCTPYFLYSLCIWESDLLYHYRYACENLQKYNVPFFNIKKKLYYLHFKIFSYLWPLIVKNVIYLWWTIQELFHLIVRQKNEVNSIWLQ